MIVTWPRNEFQRLNIRNPKDISQHKMRYGYGFGQEGWYSIIREGQNLPEFEVEEVGRTKIKTIFVPWEVNVLTSRLSTPKTIRDILDAQCFQGKLNSSSASYNYYLPKIFYRAFDYENSSYDRICDRTGNEILGGLITNIRKYVLFESQIGDAPLFRILGGDDEVGIRQKVFCTDEFYELCKPFEPTGLKFFDVEINRCDA